MTFPQPKEKKDISIHLGCYKLLKFSLNGITLSMQLECLKHKLAFVKIATQRRFHQNLKKLIPTMISTGTKSSYVPVTRWTRETLASKISDKFKRRHIP